jgi:hypothetical protein
VWKVEQDFLGLKLLIFFKPKNIEIMKILRKKIEINCHHVKFHQPISASLASISKIFEIQQTPPKIQAAFRKPNDHTLPSLQLLPTL